jgi:GT2 family glycosyltransferase
VANRYAVVVVQPPGYAHSAAFAEVAETLVHGLRALGQDVVLADAPAEGRRAIVLGSNLLAIHPMTLPPDTILYNLEQVERGSSWMTPALVDLFRRHPLWDYSARNASRYPEMGLPAPRVVPVGWVPELARIAPAEEDIDVLFYGSMNERRRAVLSALAERGLRVHAAFGVYGAERDRLVARSKVVLNVHFYEAKVFEVVRVSYLLGNGRCVVSERGADLAEEGELEGGVAFAPYEGLVDACARLCADAEARRRLAAEGRRIMVRRDERRILADALGLPLPSSDASGSTAPQPARTPPEVPSGSALAGGPASPPAADPSRPPSPPRAATAGPDARPDGTTPEPVVSIVIPSFNKWDYTFRCLLSLVQQTRGIPFETIVVDNASTDDTRLALPRLPGLRFHLNETNLGFARASNQGARMARGKHILFLNNDTEALPGWLAPMVRILDEEPDVGIVGAKLLFPDGTLQHAGVGVAYAAPCPISPFHLQYRQPPDASVRRLDLPAVTGACLLIRRELCEELGGFDEAYVNGYEDVDLCFRAREKGWRIAYTPESVLYHHESITPGRFDKTTHNTVLLHERWMGRFREFTHDRRAHRPRRRPAAGRLAISVVVPAFQALGTVARCLEDLLDGLGPSDEIVVADGGSTDGTLRFLRPFADEHRGRVRLVEAQGGLAGAIRAGLAAARRKRAVLVPATTGAQPEFLDRLGALFASSSRAALVSAVPGQGVVAAAPTDALQGIAGSGAEAFLESTAEGCAALLRAAGLAVVGAVAEVPSDRAPPATAASPLAGAPARHPGGPA